MSLLSSLQMLRARAIDELRQQFDIGRLEAYPLEMLHDGYKEIAGSVTPHPVEDTDVLLSLAIENPYFANEMPAHWTFESWAKSGNECTPIALIYEQVYQWVIGQLELYVGEHLEA